MSQKNTRLIDNCFTKSGDLQEPEVLKRWLVSFFAATAFSILGGFSLLLTRAGIDVTGGVVFTYLWYSIALTMPWFFITYHCSYKKRGTGWLVLTMVLGPFQELMRIVREGWTFPFDWGSLSWLIGSTAFGIEVYFLINCYFLYKVNAARKKLLRESDFRLSLERVQAIHAMEQSLNLSHLDAIFYRSISLWPQWERELSQVYTKQKERLTQ